LQIGTNRYDIADLVIEGEIFPDPEYGNCHAYYFNNSEWIMPTLKSKEQVYAVKMHLIPGAEIRFKIVEKVSLQ
jgi:hypothetical protein